MTAYVCNYYLLLTNTKTLKRNVYLSSFDRCASFLDLRARMNLLTNKEMNNQFSSYFYKPFLPNTFRKKNVCLNCV